MNKVDEAASPNLEVDALVKLGKHTATVDDRINMLASSEAAPFILLDEGQQVAHLTELLDFADDRLPAPRRRRGESTHVEMASFVECTNRFKTADSTIWAYKAHNGEFTMTTVFNYHPAEVAEPGAAGWGDHRAKYICPLSPAWIAWNRMSNKMVSQEEFADFVEEHGANVYEGEDGYPKTIDLLELASNLRIEQGIKVQRTYNRQTGEYTIVNTRENDETESTKLPRAIMLQLPVFDNGQTYKVEALMRCSTGSRGGAPKLGFTLQQATKIREDAILGLRNLAADETGLPVFAGKPECA